MGEAVGLKDAAVAHPLRAPTLAAPRTSGVGSQLRQQRAEPQQAAAFHRGGAELLGAGEQLLEQEEWLAKQDEHLQQEDEQIRMFDEELRRQNAQIRLALQDLARSDPGGAELEGEPLEPHPTKGWVFPFLTITGFTLSVCLLIGYKAYDFIHDSGRDLDGDGDVDFNDFKKHCSCGLSWKAWRNIGLVSLFSAAGFAFLWWMGFMQPILGSIVVYCYLGLTAIGFGAIFMAEAWTDLMGAANSILEVTHRIERFFHSGAENVEQAAESMQRCFSGGKLQPKPEAAQAGATGKSGKGAGKSSTCP